MPDGQGSNVVERTRHDSLYICYTCHVFWSESTGRPTPSVLLLFVQKNSNHFLPTCLLAFILLHGILSIIPLALTYASEGNFYIILTGHFTVVFGELE